MTRTRFRYLAVAAAIAAAAALARAQSFPYEKDLEIRASQVAIPKGAYLGAYSGEFITDEEYQRRANANKWQYMMGLLDCATPRTGGISTIDGITGNVFTRMNYAPAEFQNVKFEKICDPPFVKIVALRDIAAGEELWVDYGPRYRYDFMEDPAVIGFFADLHARRAKKGPDGM